MTNSGLILVIGNRVLYSKRHGDYPSERRGEEKRREEKKGESR
jgi:hypothetical protein